MSNPKHSLPVLRLSVTKLTMTVHQSKNQSRPSFSCPSTGPLQHPQPHVSFVPPPCHLHPLSTFMLPHHCCRHLLPPLPLPLVFLQRAFCSRHLHCFHIFARLAILTMGTIPDSEFEVLFLSLHFISVCVCVCMCAHVHLTMHF